MTTGTDFNSLLAEVTSAENALLETMCKLSQESGGEQICLGLLRGIGDRFSQKRNQTLNSALIGEENNADPNHDSSIAKPDKSYSRPPKSAVGEIYDCGLKSFDLPRDHRDHRSLAKVLIESVIIIFIARNNHNPTGVVFANVIEEIKRLRLPRDETTLRGRLRELKRQGLLDPDAGFGKYRITSEGHRLAVKAIQDYGFKIDIGPFADTKNVEHTSVHLATNTQLP